MEAVRKVLWFYSGPWDKQGFSLIWSVYIYIIHFNATATLVRHTRNHKKASRTKMYIIHLYMHVCVYFTKRWENKSVQLFVTPWSVARQTPPSMGFSRQECWSGLPFPSPGNLPNPGIKPVHWQILYCWGNREAPWLTCQEGSMLLLFWKLKCCLRADYDSWSSWEKWRLQAGLWWHSLWHLQLIHFLLGVKVVFGQLVC